MTRIKVRIEVDGQVVDELVAPVGMTFGEAVLAGGDGDRTIDLDGRTVVVGPLDGPDEAFVVLRFDEGQVTMVKPDEGAMVFGRIFMGNPTLVFSPFKAVVLEAGTTRVMERWSEASRVDAEATGRLREQEWARERTRVEIQVEETAPGRLSEMIETLGPVPRPVATRPFAP